MEPNEDSELRELLREWQAPPVPAASMERRLFGARKSWWCASIRVPFPIACCLALSMAALVWRSVQPPNPLPPRVVIETERVAVPVVRDRVVTKIVYKYRPARTPEHELTFNELRPVAELRLRIVRHQDAKN
jgi:hypothetical protein